MPAKINYMQNPVPKPANPVVHSRSVRELTKLLLITQAGGRCEFAQCNRYVLEHPLTLTSGNFAQVAHVVAFQLHGPRGSHSTRPADINELDNLMLLCPACHKLIDDNPKDYTVESLRDQKQVHEKRIRHVTGLDSHLRTTIVQLKSQIAGQMVDIPVSHVTKAIAPRYPVDLKGHVIDLAGIPDGDRDYYRTAQRTIRNEITRLYAPGMDADRTRHISLFALAPIPLLVFLGSHLSNKIPTELYQRHRDTEEWVWKEDGTIVEYRLRCRRKGTDNSKVALLLSLSGLVPLEALPKQLLDSFTVYEIIPRNCSPGTMHLRRREDLENFRTVYRMALRQIAVKHGLLRHLHLFPAVPAPVAVACGYDLLPKIDPKLKIYDFDKARGGYNSILEVN